MVMEDFLLGVESNIASILITTEVGAGAQIATKMVKLTGKTIFIVTGGVTVIVALIIVIMRSYDSLILELVIILQVRNITTMGQSVM